MSMILVLTTISQRNIDAIGQDPALVWRFIAPDDPDVYLEARHTPPKGEVISRLMRSQDQIEDDVPNPDLEPGEGVDYDLDKAWHAIHFLLTGSTWQGEFPLAFLLVGGTEVPGIEVGYSAARIVNPAEVASIDHALSAVSVDELCDRFDGKAMAKADVYPSIWARDDRAECLDYIRENYEDLRSCVKSARERGLGLIITVT